MTSITVTRTGSLRIVAGTPFVELTHWAVRRDGRELSRHATYAEAVARAAATAAWMAEAGEVAA
jgi:hypothetical protein